MWAALIRDTIHPGRHRDMADQMEKRHPRKKTRMSDARARLIG
jgi:hypothetical protein